MDNKFSELSGLFSNLPDTSSGVFPDLRIHIFQAIENSREDLWLDDNLGQINGVFSNLSQALADIALELSIGMINQSS